MLAFSGPDGQSKTVSHNQPLPVVSGLNVPPHDYAELSYQGENLAGVTYKIGGTWDSGSGTYVGGSTVGQIELIYSSGKLIKIVEV